MSTSFSAIESTLADSESRTATSLFREHQQAIYERTDRMFVALMSAQWLAAVAIALWVSPKTWVGTSSQIHPHVWAAAFLGGVISVFPILLGWKRPGAISTRYT